MKMNNIDFRETDANLALQNLFERRNPFDYLQIDDNNFLNNISGRSPCSRCSKSRKFFCYTCYVPIDELRGKLPIVKLPVKIDIIKHKNEIDGKSTAVHAAILAPDDVRMFTYPNIPDYKTEDGVYLIYPSHVNSITVRCILDKRIKMKQPVNNFNKPKGHNFGTLLKFRLNNEENKSSKDNELERYNLDNLPIKRVIFIDSTWNQSRGIFKDPRISSLQSVVLQNRLSQFWRHQKGSPRWFLATIEAIHQLLLEVHIDCWGLDTKYVDCLKRLEVSEQMINNAVLRRTVESKDGNCRPYDGQYDNLLFFFSHMYDLIHTFYDHNDLIAYRRPIE